MSEVEMIIIDREGDSHKVKAPVDLNMSLMEVIKSNELVPEGTMGFCGGDGSCGSCHVYILKDTGLPEKSFQEQDTLIEVEMARDNSRLGCQVQVSKEMEGLKFEIPKI